MCWHAEQCHKPGGSVQFWQVTYSKQLQLLLKQTVQDCPLGHDSGKINYLTL